MINPNSPLIFRIDVIWTPDDYTIEDLVVVLGEKVSILFFIFW